MHNPTDTTRPQETAGVNCPNPTTQLHGGELDPAPRPCPPWCPFDHDTTTARLHVRDVFDYVGDGGDRIEIKVVRYDAPDGVVHGPTVVSRRRGDNKDANVFTAEEARRFAAMLAPGAHRSKLIADLVHAFTAAADLAETTQ